MIYYGRLIKLVRMVVSPFFRVFDAADRMAIGAKLYYHAKVGSFRDSIRVLRDSIRVSVFVWSFACLYANAVEIGQYMLMVALY